MWCRNCQQDVPAFDGADAGACCLRCGQPLDKPWPARQIDEALGLDLLAPAEKDAADSIVAEIEPKLSPRPEPKDDEPAPALNVAAGPPLAAWDLDEKLREAERLLGLAPGAASRRLPERSVENAAALQAGYRIDAAHGPAARGTRAEVEPVERAKLPGDARRSFLTWTAICLGLMTFACGGSLLVCAYLQQRGDLWDLGVPMTLAGQVGLLLGLGLQLERLWLENRHTADKLARVDRQLHDLHETAHLLGGPYYSASESFYQHLSAGASPQTLLADLKSQLDLLATHMGREGRR